MTTDFPPHGDNSQCGDSSEYGRGPEYGASAFQLPELADAALEIVDQIPSGKVLAYGDIAELLGRGGPRQVGAVMSRYGSSVPWWRVTRASGEGPAGLREEALAHWRAEGTPLVGGQLAGRRVDMTHARWEAQAGLRAQTEPPTAGQSDIVPC